MDAKQIIRITLYVAAGLILGQVFINLPQWLILSCWGAFAVVIVIRIAGWKWSVPAKFAYIFTFGVSVLVPIFHDTWTAIGTLVMHPSKPWAEKLFLSQSSLGLMVIYLLTLYSGEREFIRRLTADHQRLQGLLEERSAKAKGDGPTSPPAS